MLDVVMVVPLPVSEWRNVVNRETYLNKDGQKRERMVGNLHDLVESIEWIQQINPGGDAPCRLVVYVNGGIEEDAIEIDGYLKSIPYDYAYIQQREVKGYGECLYRALEACPHKFVALVPGSTMIRESQWAEKMQVVFLKDRNACMVGTTRLQKDNSFPPYLLPRDAHPDGDLALLKKDICSAINWSKVENAADISKQIANMRGHRWIAPSVRFSDQEWAPTTPESSDATTHFA